MYMTKEEIFNYFYTNSVNLGLKNILLTLAGGLIISIIIYFTYKYTNKGVSYNSKFNESLVITLLISVVIMLLISSNIVISLGMVGALSIVRFRTAIKDPRDTVFMFFSISEGLCVGSSNFYLALITTLFIAIVIILFSFVHERKNRYLIILGANRELINLDDVALKIDEYTVSSKLRNVLKDGNHEEIIYEVITKGELNPKIIEAICNIKGVKTVNYIVESGELLG